MAHRSAQVAQCDGRAVGRRDQPNPGAGGRPAAASARTFFSASMVFRSSSPRYGSGLGEIEELATYFRLARRVRHVAPGAEAHERGCLRRSSTMPGRGTCVELRNVMDRAVLLSTDDVVTLEHPPLEQATGATSPRRSRPSLASQFAPRGTRTRTFSRGGSGRARAPGGRERACPLRWKPDARGEAPRSLARHAPRSVWTPSVWKGPGSDKAQEGMAARPPGCARVLGGMVLGMLPVLGRRVPSGERSSRRRGASSSGPGVSWVMGARQTGGDGGGAGCTSTGALLCEDFEEARDPVRAGSAPSSRRAPPSVSIPPSITEARTSLHARVVASGSGNTGSRAEGIFVRSFTQTGGSCAALRLILGPWSRATKPFRSSIKRAIRIPWPRSGSAPRASGGRTSGGGRRNRRGECSGRRGVDVRRMGDRRRDGRHARVGK